MILLPFSVVTMCLRAMAARLVLPSAHDCIFVRFQYLLVMLQTVHQARIEQANGSGRAVSEERVLPDHKASLKEKDAELQVSSHHCMF